MLTRMVLEYRFSIGQRAMVNLGELARWLIGIAPMHVAGMHHTVLRIRLHPIAWLVGSIFIEVSYMPA